jgi:hypothetical protein
VFGGIDDPGEHGIGTASGDLGKLQHDRQLTRRQLVEHQAAVADLPDHRVGAHRQPGDLDGRARFGES